MVHLNTHFFLSIAAFPGYNFDEIHQPVYKCLLPSDHGASLSRFITLLEKVNNACIVA